MFFTNIKLAEKYNYLNEKFLAAYDWLRNNDLKKKELRHMINFLISSVWWRVLNFSEYAVETLLK